jgi:hypothetical protein
MVRNLILCNCGHLEINLRPVNHDSHLSTIITKKSGSSSYMNRITRLYTIDIGSYRSFHAKDGFTSPLHWWFGGSARVSTHGDMARLPWLDSHAESPCEGRLSCPVAGGKALVRPCDRGYEDLSRTLGMIQVQDSSINSGKGVEETGGRRDKSGNRGNDIVVEVLHRVLRCWKALSIRTKVPCIQQTNVRKRNQPESRRAVCSAKDDRRQINVEPLVGDVELGIAVNNRGVKGHGDAVREISLHIV